MYRIDNPTSWPLLPTPSAVGPNPDGYFGDNNPANGIPATVVDAEWVNMVQEELCNVITKQGQLDPILNKSLRNQLLLAIRREVAAGLGTATPPPPDSTALPPLETYTSIRHFDDTPVVPAPNNQTVTACSMKLTTGNWYVWGHIGFSFTNANTQINQLIGGVGVGTSTIPAPQTGLSARNGFGGIYAPSQFTEFYSGQAIVNLPGANTSIHLLGQANWFNGHAPNVFGFLSAMRV